MKYVVFDVETPNERNDRMSSIAVSVVENGKIVKEFYSLLNPETYFNSFNISLTGITPESVKDAPTFPEAFKELRELFDEGILVAHNAPFDMSVLKKCLNYYGIFWRERVKYACTCQMARRIYPSLPSKKLDALCCEFKIPLDHHNAKSDTRAAAELLIRYEKEGFSAEAFAKDYYLI